MKLKRLTTFSGVPSNLARSFGSCVQTPTGQVLEWHCRTMMQPMAISEAVPMPYSSAPSMAAITTSRPVLMPPSVRSSTLSRSRLSVSTWWVSDRPISQGMPAYLMLVCGRGAGAAAMARDQDHVGLGLGDAGRDGADARARHQLHA